MDYFCYNKNCKLNVKTYEILQENISKALVLSLKSDNLF